VTEQVVEQTAKKGKLLGLLPVRGSIEAAKIKGKVGEFLTKIERGLHLEKVVGKQVTLEAGGARARIDFITRNILTGKLRAVESKFGQAARLVRGQPAVAEALELTGAALARGRKSVQT
jgi:hypothetical protein